MKYLVGLLVAVIVGGAGVAFLYRPQVATQERPTGSAGPDQYSFANFFGGQTVGQGVIASTTLASMALSGNEFINADTLNYNELNAADTLTLPASTTPMCSQIGLNQRRRLVIRNMASTSLTLAGSASIPLKSASTTKVIAGTTDASAMGFLDIVKIAPTTTGVGCVANLTTYI